MKTRKIAALAAGILFALSISTAQAAEPQPQQTDTSVSIPQDGCLTNGKPITEENVLKILRQLEEEWPTWTPWDDPKLNPDTYKNTVPSTESAKLMRRYRINSTYGCGGYASMISSRIFGDKINPYRLEYR